MVNIDWKRLKNIDLDDLQDEEQDEIYSELIHVGVDDEKEVEKLQIMLKLSQVIMKSKSLQAELAMEELDKLAEIHGTTSGKTVQRLTQENEDLKQQILHLEKFGDSRDVSKSTQGGNDEIRRFRREIEKLQLELQTAERNLEKEKNQTEKYFSRLEESERELRANRQEINNLRDEIQDYRHRLESQSDSILNRHQDVNRSNKIRDKNQQINKLLEEIEILEKSNHEFHASSVELRSKLEEATKQMEITTAEYLRLKTALSQSENVIDDLQKENTELRSHFEELVEISREKEENEEKIADVFNQKIDGWKVIVANKDKDIDESHRRITELEERINTNLSSGDGTSVLIFTKTLEDRDKRINLLTEQLAKATADYQQTTKFIESLSLTQKGDNINSDAKYQNQINILQSVIKEKDEAVIKINQLLTETEAHASNKDKELISALIRLREYESGEYGLTDAVAEIKDLKIQLKKRDEKVEELTKDVNKKDVQVGELLDENEELRTRLGLDPLDPALIAREGINRRWSERCLNERLKEEVEKLEEERVEMKMEIRRLAQAAGLRTSISGISDGLSSIKEDDEKIKQKSERVVDGSVKLLREQNLKLQEEQSYLTDQLQTSLQENSKFRQLLKQANEDVEHLENGLKEVLDALRNQNGVSDAALQCPSLDKLVLLIESKRLTGSYDRAIYVKSQLDLERGKNEELRQELRQFRQDFIEKTKISKINKIEKSEKTLVKMTSFSSFSLPENLTMTSSSTIAILNTQLVDVLDAFEKKSKQCDEMEKVVEKCQEKFDVIWSERGLLYEEFKNEKKNWEDERKKMIDKNNQILQRNDELEITAEEFRKMKEILSSDEHEMRRRVAELSGHLIISKINEKNCHRKCSILTTGEKESTKKIDILENDLMELSTSNDNHVIFLEEFKETANFKINKLQRELDNSIPISTFRTLERQFHDVTSKYQDVLQRVSEIDVEIQRNTENELKSKSSSKQESPTDKNQLLIETQLNNEKCRADHAENLLKHERETVKKTMQRNHELEEKLQEMTENYFDHSHNDHKNENGQKISKLEEKVVKLKTECEKWKKVAEIARNQVESFRIKLDRRENIKTSLQQRVLCLESSADEKMEIGKVHRELLKIKNELLEKESKLQRYQLKLRDVEARNLRLEKKCVESEETLFKCHSENRRQVQMLQSALQHARQKRVGIDLKNREDEAEIILQLKKNQLLMKTTLKDTSKMKIEAEEKLIEANLVLRDVKEIARTLKDGDSALRLIEQHDEMSRIRLENMKLQRENQRIKDKLTHQDNLLTKNEVEISKLERDIVQLSDENETQQQYQFQHRHSQQVSSRKQQEKPKDDKKIDKIAQLKDENQNLRRKLTKLELKLQENIVTISSRDEIISKLKIRRISKIEFEVPSHDKSDDLRQGLELRHGLDVLQSHVETLQARLLQKEEAIERYCVLLQEAREGLVESEKRHQMTLQTLQSKLHQKTDLTLEKFKEIVREASEKSRRPPELLRSQSIQIQKLDDTVAEQDIALRNLADKLKDTQQQNETLSKQLGSTNKQYLTEIERTTEHCKKKIEDLNEELLETKTKNQIFKNEINKLEEEIRVQKAENLSAPSVVHQKAMQKLKEEVAIKEKQLQSLSRTLTDLKAEMLVQSQEHAMVLEEVPIVDVRNHLVNDLEQRIEQLEKQNTRLRREKSNVDAELQEIKRERVKTSRTKDDSGLKSKDGQTKTDEKVIRWEEKKKWQKVVEKLKDEVKKEKTAVEELEKRFKLQRSVIERLENEKKFLEKRIKSEKDKKASGLARNKVDDVVELQEQLTYINDENVFLKDRVAELEEMLNKTEDAGEKEDIADHYLKIINRINGENAKLKDDLENIRKQQLIEENRLKSLEITSEKLLTENNKLFKELQKEKKISKNLNQKELELKHDIRNLENELKECNDNLNTLQSKIPINYTNQYQLVYLDKKNLSLKIEQLESELNIKSRILDEINLMIKRALGKGGNLRLLVSRLSEKIQESHM